MCNKELKKVKCSNGYYDMYVIDKFGLLKLIIKSKYDNEEEFIDFINNYKKDNEPESQIEDVKDDILDAIISCQDCKKAFRIIKQELEFLRGEQIPLPRLCVDCRHFKRVTQRLPSRLWPRHCMKPGCANEFKTSYAPDRPEIVYCEKCYKEEVY